MTPDFDSVIGEFRAFLDREGLPTHLLWVFREDVSTRAKRIFVRWPLPSENEEIARARYYVGIGRGLGLRLEVICLLGISACCHVWIPGDEADASYAMLSGTRFSVPVKPIHARPIARGLPWRLIRWLNEVSDQDHLSSWLQAGTPYEFA